MKKIFILIMAFIFPLYAYNITIEVDGGKYEVNVPENIEELSEAYVRAIRAYLEESIDYEELSYTFDKYKASAEETIKAKDELIEEQKNLIDFRDRQIAELKQGKIFSIIPHVSYARELEENKIGVGAGFILFDSFFFDTNVLFPIQFEVSVGWKF